MRTRPDPLHALGLLALALACARPEPVVRPPAPAPPAERPPAIPACERILRIEVSKAERRLRAHCQGGAVVTLTAAMGRHPQGPKQAAGDFRTPEGLYRISGPARPSRFHRFIPIDYPSPEDAQTALAQGRISRRDYERILAARERGLPPPADTALGGELGLHGEGPRWQGDSLDLDWTYGCVALPDADIDFLAERVEIGTEVWIGP